MVETIAAIRSAVAQMGVATHVSVLDQGSTEAELTLLAAPVLGVANIGLYGVAHNLGVPGGRNRLSSMGHGAVMIGLENDAVFATLMWRRRRWRGLRISQTWGLWGLRF